MTPEQIGLMVVFGLIALLNYAVQIFRRRQQRSARETTPGAPAPPPVPEAVRVPRTATPPRAPSSHRVAAAPRAGDGRRAAPQRQRPRPRYDARAMRRAVVLTVVLAPPGGRDASRAI